MLRPALTNERSHRQTKKVDWRAKLAISQKGALKRLVKDVCTQTTDEETASAVPAMAPHIRGHVQVSAFQNMVVLQSIHLQKSEIYGNLPFTILMTLQQSVVAERGRESGGSRASRWEKGLRVLL